MPLCSYATPVRQTRKKQVTTKIYLISPCAPFRTEDLFLRKIHLVVLVGEVEAALHESLPVTLEESHQEGHQSRLHFTPKYSSTVKHDMTAARFFYQHFQKLGVPLTIVNDEVARVLA